MKKYILFDCDGNVVDSEIVTIDAARFYVSDFAKKLHFNISCDSIDGVSAKKVIRATYFLARKYGLEKIRREIKEGILSALSKNTKPVEGAAEFLELASIKGYTNVIVTNSEFDMAVAALTCANIKCFFRDENIFSAISTLKQPQPKPDKAIYSYALEKLSIGAAETFSSEDSASGVCSAVGANIPCFGNVAGSHIKSDAPMIKQKLLDAGAVHVFKDWKEMSNILTSWENGLFSRRGRKDVVANKRPENLVM